MRFTKSILTLETNKLESNMAIKIDNIDNMPHSKLVASASVPIRSWIVVTHKDVEHNTTEVQSEVHELFRQFSVQDIEVFSKLFAIALDLHTPFMHLQADDNMFCMRLEDEDRDYMMAQVEKAKAAGETEVTIN